MTPGGKFEKSTCLPPNAYHTMFYKICISNAVVCGGMLRVIAEEILAFIVIPILRAVAGTGMPLVFKMMVRGFTTSLTVCRVLKPVI